MGTKRSIVNFRIRTGTSPVPKKSHHMAVIRSSSSQTNINSIEPNKQNNEEEAKRLIESLLANSAISKNLSTSMPDMSRVDIGGSGDESVCDGSPKQRTRGDTMKDEESAKKTFLPKIFRISKNVKHSASKKRIVISSPTDDLLCVSQVVKTDELPDNVRRIRLCKRDSDPNFGLYIRDSYRTDSRTDAAIKRRGVFVSRFIAGGLAERSGLLSVNDEIVDINGDLVEGLRLEDVYNLMRRDSKEMVLTLKPVHLQDTVT